MLNVITTSRPFILPLVVFPKTLFSALYSSSCTLPLSVLWSLPFLLTTAFMQTTLSSSSLSTPHPLNFDSNISDLQNALQHISSWMTANLLTLNSYKTEFLLITFVNFAVSSLTSIRQLPIPLLPLSFIHSFIHMAIRPLWPQSWSLNLTWFTPNLSTVILSTINFLSLNYPVSCRSRTLLLVLSLKHLPIPCI